MGRLVLNRNILNIQRIELERQRREEREKRMRKAVLRIRIRDPGFGDFLTPGSGIRDGQKIRIRDEHPGLYFRELENSFWG